MRKWGKRFRTLSATAPACGIFRQGTLPPSSLPHDVSFDAVGAADRRGGPRAKTAEKISCVQAGTSREGSGRQGVGTGRLLQAGPGRRSEGRIVRRGVSFGGWHPPDRSSGRQRRGDRCIEAIDRRPAPRRGRRSAPVPRSDRFGRRGWVWREGGIIHGPSGRGGRYSVPTAVFLDAVFLAPSGLRPAAGLHPKGGFAERSIHDTSRSRCPRPSMGRRDAVFDCYHSASHPTFRSFQTFRLPKGKTSGEPACSILPPIGTPKAQSAGVSGSIAQKSLT